MKNDFKIIIFHALIKPGNTKTQKVSNNRKFFMSIYSGMIPPEKYMVATTNPRIAVFPLNRFLLSGYAMQIVKIILNAVLTRVRIVVKTIELSTLPFLAMDAYASRVKAVGKSPTFPEMIADFELSESAMIWMKGRMHNAAKDDTTMTATAPNIFSLIRYLEEYII